MTAWLALCLRTIIVVIRPSRYANLDASLAGPRFCQTDLGKLRIGKGDPDGLRRPPEGSLQWAGAKA